MDIFLPVHFASQGPRVCKHVVSLTAPDVHKHEWAKDDAGVLCLETRSRLAKSAENTGRKQP
eukprot:1141631-Pelagomonas_calceolata.AAC.3